MRILVVEDDDKIASFIVKGFRQAGFAVDHATDGEDGLHLALTEPYDACIIDIMLPKLDGLSLIDEMRHQKSTRSKIVIPWTVVELAISESCVDFIFIFG